MAGYVPLEALSMALSGVLKSGTGLIMLLKAFRRLSHAFKRLGWAYWKLDKAS